MKGRERESRINKIKMIYNCKRLSGGLRREMLQINVIGSSSACKENPNKWLSIICDLKMLLRELLNRNEQHAPGGTFQHNFDDMNLFNAAFGDVFICADRKSY